MRLFIIGGRAIVGKNTLDKLIKQYYVEIDESGKLKNGILILEFKYDNILIDDSIYTLHKFKKYGDKFISIYKKTIDYQLFFWYIYIENRGGFLNEKIK